MSRERQGPPAGRLPCVALLPWPDRFEDFFDKLDVTFETFREEFTGSWVFNYVAALQRAGVRPVLYFFSLRVSDTMRFTHVPTGAEVRVLRVPWLHRKLRGARERYLPRSALVRSVESYVATPLWRLARQLRADGCDAVLCQEYEYPRFDVSVALGRALRLPVFATFQGGDETAHPVERLTRGAAIRSARGLITGSRAEAERLRRRYRVHPDRVALIPNPFDVARWRRSPKGPGRAELGIPPARRVVTWQGRVSIDQKGLDVLLPAWRQVCARSEQPPLLLLVGDGPDAARLRQLVDAAPPGTVQWVDRFVMDRELLWRYLSAADIAVLPSRREGFPVAVVEAMACGLPVVAADAQGVRDAIGEGAAAGGLVVPREDPVALAEALSRVLADEELGEELGIRGRRRAEDLFSLEAAGRQLRDHLFPAGEGA
jgi:glycosyltransferase involved in cell wall biosynthesis